jgi:hypothetical protein
MVVAGMVENCESKRGVRWPGERENVTTTQKFLQVAEFITLSYAT